MSVPAGWYDDGSGRQRWWDGEQWTDTYAPEAPTSAGGEDGGTVLGESTATSTPEENPTLAYPPADQNGYPQSSHGQSQYEPPQYEPPQYGQQTYGDQQYGQQQYGAPQYAQQPYPGAADQANPYGAPSPYGADPYAAYAAPDVGPRKTPVLGYISLGLAVVGGIIACIPNFVTFGIGSFLLFGASPGDGAR